jgi:hypothetical protein
MSVPSLISSIPLACAELHCLTKRFPRSIVDQDQTGAGFIAGIAV